MIATAQRYDDEWEVREQPTSGKAIEERFSVGDRVQIREDCQPFVLPQHIMGKIGTVVNVYEGIEVTPEESVETPQGGLTEDATPTSIYPLYRLRIRRESSRSEEEFDISEDCLEPA